MKALLVCKDKNNNDILQDIDSIVTVTVNELEDGTVGEGCYMYLTSGGPVYTKNSMNYVRGKINEFLAV